METIVLEDDECDLLLLKEIKIDLVYDDEDEIPEQEILDHLNKNKYANMKRGDVIHIEGTSRYRNDNKFMWNGTKFVALDDVFDEYGCVPREFLTFAEFPVGYFTGRTDRESLHEDGPIEHNYIHHIGLEAVRNLNYVGPFDVFEDKYHKYTFEAEGKTWKLGTKKKLKKGQKVVTVEAWDEDAIEYVDFLEK